MTSESPSAAIIDAREYFPRGLVQPAKGCRFSMDPLLLAAFAAQSKWQNALDLGAGCGVAGLALLLIRTQQAGIAGRVLGVDQDVAMLTAAEENARLLGVEDQYTTGRVDLAAPDAAWKLLAPDHSMDLVLSNPPFRAQQSGRTPPDANRLTARFETGAGLPEFAVAARRVLTTKGRFCIVYLAERLSQACAVLEEGGFAVKRVLPVHGKADQPAKLVLVEARKGGGPGMQLLPPLVLYAGAGQECALTQEALAFCPFLACNA